MDRLPYEVLLQIFEHISFTDYKTLYYLFPQRLVDEALVYKIRHQKSVPLLDLVSTNLHELSTLRTNQRNESFLSLFFASYDPLYRFIWTLPDFSHAQHFFKVKDAYVSHGKLVLRQPHGVTQQPLMPLWDIRKSFPPTRAGSFSGASEYTKITSQELTVHQSGCIMDSCLIPASSHDVIVLKSEKKDQEPKRPSLPTHYQRKTPSMPFYYSDPTCGYFLVERLAISIPTLLELFES